MDQVKQRTMLELVKVAKEKGDADAILEIVRYMQPLINKYSKNSYLAEYEDMQQELCLALLESIHKIKKIENEGQCVQSVSYTHLQYPFMQKVSNTGRSQKSVSVSSKK